MLYKRQQKGLQWAPYATTTNYSPPQLTWGRKPPVECDRHIIAVHNCGCSQRGVGAVPIKAVLWAMHPKQTTPSHQHIWGWPHTHTLYTDIPQHEHHWGRLQHAASLSDTCWQTLACWGWPHIVTHAHCTVTVTFLTQNSQDNYSGHENHCEGFTRS